MIVAIGLLGLLVLMALALGWMTFRFGRQAPAFLEGKLDVEFADAHPPVARAFSRKDLDFLMSRENHTPQSIRRFRRARRRVMNLFLRDIRRDFYRAWSVCRQLAPVSDDPEFGVNLFKQFLTFHQLYFRVRILSVVSLYWHEDFEFGAIVDVLGTMQQSAAQMVRLSQISAAPSPAY